MSTLSIARGGRLPFVVAASPVFTLSKPDDFSEGGMLVFEMFERDARELKTLVGTPQSYALDAAEQFEGVIISLEPCGSTHTGLSLMRDKPAVRVSVRIFPEGATQH
jgi:hypothetical protein